MAFVINVIKWLLWTVETMYFYVVEPFIISTVTKSSLGSISWATVLISLHWNVTLQQLYVIQDSVLSEMYYSFLEPQRYAKHNCGLSTLRANTRRWFAGPMLAHRLWLWPSIKPALVQDLVFPGPRSIARSSGSTYCWRGVQADTDPMAVKCWASVASACQYPFSL